MPATLRALPCSQRPSNLAARLQAQRPYTAPAQNADWHSDSVRAGEELGSRPFTWSDQFERSVLDH